MENPAVPLAALTENFSSIDLIAPPPLGSVMDGMDKEEYSLFLSLSFPVFIPDLLFSGYSDFCITRILMGQEPFWLSLLNHLQNINPQFARNKEIASGRLLLMSVCLFSASGKHAVLVSY